MDDVLISNIKSYNYNYNYNYIKNGLNNDPYTSLMFTSTSTTTPISLTQRNFYKITTLLFVVLVDFRFR